MMCYIFCVHDGAQIATSDLCMCYGIAFMSRVACRVLCVVCCVVCVALYCVRYVYNVLYVWYVGCVCVYIYVVLCGVYNVFCVSCMNML